METIINNVVVKTMYRYKKGEDSWKSDDKEYFIVLELPVPGGRVTYELEVSKQTVDNVELASKLCSTSQKT